MEDFDNDAGQVSKQRKYVIHVASFPGLPTVQFFDRLQYAETGWWEGLVMRL